MWLMWKAFTSAALCLTLVGCASTGGAPQPATAGEDPAAAAVDGGPAARPMPPMPEVSGHNADVFARATELFLDGRLVEAEALLLEVTADQPELAGPWVNLAQVYLAQERPDEALGALEQAVLANPGNCAARTELGKHKANLAKLTKERDEGAERAQLLRQEKSDVETLG